jgi:alpha-glucosidase
MRDAVKATNPEAYLIGEHFYDPTDSLNGDQWDGVMNYAGFMTPVLAWFRGAGHHLAHDERIRDAPLTTDELVEVLAAFRAAVPWAVAGCQYDLLDSHDTARVRSAVGGDMRRVRATFGLLFGYVGVPGVFYGDEVGLDGANGDAARRPMPWDPADWDLDQLAFVRSLIRLRTRSRALQAGGFQVLEAADDSLAFLRDTDEEQAIVVVARGPAPRAAGDLDVGHGAVADGTSFVEALTGQRATVAGGRLALPGMDAGAAIWISA